SLRERRVRRTGLAPDAASTGYWTRCVDSSILVRRRRRGGAYNKKRMHLTEEQSNYLRILGHTLTPVVDVGPGGVTDSLRKELDKALAEHELVKVRVRFGDKQRRQRIFAELAPMADACLVKD